MSNIPTNPAQLLQGLSQLSQLSSNAATSSNTTRVIINQITNTQIALGTVRNAVTLPTERLSGRVESGKQYQVNLESSGNASQLNFYTPDTNFTQQLDRRQSESLIGQLSSVLSQQQIDDVLQLQVKAASVKANSLTLNINGKALSFDIANASQRFVQGQNLILNLKASPQGWLISLTTNENSSATLIRISPQQALTILASQQERIFQVPENQLNLPQNLSRAAKNTQTQTPNSALNPTTSRPSANPVSVNIGTNGLIQIERNPTPVASLPITKANIDTLKQVGIKTAAPPTQNNTASSNSAPNKHNPVTLSEQIEPNETTSVRSSGTNPSQNTTTRLNITPQLQQAIQSLVRQIQPIQDSPAQSLQRLDALLADPLIQQDPILRAEATQIKTQLQLISPGLDSDGSPELIRQILSSSPIPVNSQQITSSSTNNHFLSGIISLIQLSLSAKLANDKPSNIERLGQILAPILSSPLASSTSASAPRTALTKRLADWFQIEQKHQGLLEIGKLLASHQHSKLAGVEQQIEGTDSLYYVLPLGNGEHRTDAEIMIRREPEPEKNDDEQEQRSAWQLTMKLDIGDKGQILSKARLLESDLELDFYASNQQLVDDVLNFLPYLKKRFEELGILITKRSCQLGKIPPHLYQRPYHILETRV